jgi:hypothetical protein
VPAHFEWLKCHLHAAKVTSFILCFAIALVTCALQSYVRTRYAYEDDAWREFWHSFLRKES